MIILSKITRLWTTVQTNSRRRDWILSISLTLQHRVQKQYNKICSGFFGGVWVFFPVTDVYQKSPHIPLLLLHAINFSVSTEIED